MDKIRRNQYRWLLLYVFLVIMAFPVRVQAKEDTEKVVRVGWYEDAAYNITNTNGERSGYGYEYQQAVSAYTGWTYEYVNGDWSELLEMLQNGEIDLMSGVSYTEDRTKKMMFSDMPMSEEKYYLYADLAKAGISASDLNTLNGKQIGMLEDSIPTTLFREWEKKHNLDIQEVSITSGEDALDKLEKGKIDGFISVESPKWEKTGLSAFASFGSSGCYFVINKQRTDLKEELDNAMRRIEHDRPFYMDDLYQRYLSAKSVEILSDEELAWVAEHGDIRIGYLNDDEGVSTLNPASGEMVGVMCDYVQYAADCLGNQKLKFDLVGYDSRDEQLNALHDGDIDMIFHVSQNPYAAEQNDFILSNTVWAFNLAAITTRDHFNENEENSIAVLKDNFALQQYISYNYPKWKMTEYDSMQEIAKAVLNGQADCFVTDASQALKYVKNKRFYSVFLTQPGNTSFAVSKGNTVLLSILNKTLKTMPDAMLNGALAMYSGAPEKVTMLEFIKANLMIVSLICIGIVLVILFIVLGLLRKSRIAEEKAKEAMRQAEKANAAKTTFLNNMSHDIRTPINGIIGMLTIIQKSENDPERVQDCLNKINQSSKLLLSLVNDVLDMAKLETDAVILNNESINLDQVCDEVTTAVAFQAETAGIKLTGEHDDYSDIYVWSSALHLKKILINLFTNSVKYNKPGGSIHMSMHTIERTEERITCEFRIEDTGLGMSEDFVKNKLFQPFVQAENSSRSNYMGTGLGMSIVKQIVEKMGGTISVESTLGEGSCFTVVLPFQLDQQSMKEMKKDALDTNIAGMHLLVAEDNELNMEIANFMLTESGARVEMVSNGLEALQMFEASEEGTFDVILMDVMMPVMDGLTATQKIRALERLDAKSIPIIAMTANAFKEDEEKCLKAGMNAHLVKPLDIEVIKQTIAVVRRAD